MPTPEESPALPGAAPAAPSRRSRAIMAASGRALLVASGHARPVLAGTGAFLVAAGLLLRFYAAPRLIAAPASLYQQNVLTARHASYFDQGTLTSRRGVTLTYTSTVRGDPAASTGAIAVWDSYSVLADRAHHVQVSTLYQRSAFNRHSGQLTACCGAAINDDTRIRQYGIGPFWPIGTRKVTYQVYDPSTERAWPAVYTGTASMDGVLAYRFAQHIRPTLVERLPGVPSRLLRLAGPARTVLASRYYQAENTFWIDPRTGVVLNVEERIRSVLHGPGGRGHLLVVAADLRMGQSTRRALAALATKNADAIATLRTTAPLGGGLLGLALLLAGALPLRRQWRRGRAWAGRRRR
jgi:hypothetical protein